MADPAVDRRAHRASATRDGRPRDRRPRRLVHPVQRADGHLERLGVLLAADPCLAARGRWIARARLTPARSSAAGGRGGGRLARCSAAGGESRGDRADDGLSRHGLVAAHARRGRPDRFRWGHRIARMDRAREGTAAVARSDLVLAVLVALADPGPRAGGARPGRGDRRRSRRRPRHPGRVGGYRHRARCGHMGVGGGAVPSRSSRASRSRTRRRADGCHRPDPRPRIDGDRHGRRSRSGGCDSPRCRRSLDRRRGLAGGSRRSRSAAVERERVVDGAGGRASHAADAGSDSGLRAVPDRLEATVNRAASEAPDRGRSAS